jgi:four helix bundle protein
MAGIERFEELIAWQKAKELTKPIYTVTRHDAFAKDFGLAGQIQRAAVSIMSNIAEGFERSNRGDFHRFRCIAKGSCGEVRSQLYIAFEVGYLSQAEFDQLCTLAREISKIISGLITSLEQQRRQ